MHIIMISSGKIPHRGGKSTHVMDLSAGLRLLGHQVTIISSNNDNKALVWFLRLLLAPVRIINKQYYLYYMSVLLSKHRSALCARQPHVDMIIAQDATVATGVFQNKKFRHVLKYLTMHTYFGIETKLDGGLVSDALYKKTLQYEQKCLYSTDGIVCVDDRIFESIKDTVHELGLHQLANKIASIPNFTNLDRFRPVDASAKQALRAKYSFDNDRFICVCARRLVEKNGVFYAIDAMRHLDAHYMLIIAGTGPEKSRLDAHIAEHGLRDRVVFLGGISNEQIHELYQLADVSVVPSITVMGLQEATSITAIEGMACATPTIASAIGGLRQLIQNGETGILLEEQDSTQIADAIRQLDKDKEFYAKLSKEGSKYIAENHSHVKAAQKYLDIYKGFAAQNEEVLK